MVNLAYKNALPGNIIQQHQFNWMSLPVEEIFESDLRLEAGVYATEAGKAKQAVLNCKYGTTRLSELVSQCYYPERFRRICVSRRSGEKLFLPSQINEVDPVATKFIATRRNGDTEKLKIKRGVLLITRSGTTGNCAVSGRTLEGGLLSDDVIRLSTRNEEDPGYLYTFLTSQAGKSILRASHYGAVIKHIEPSHLLRLTIPDAPRILKRKIHNLITGSVALRDESNDLIRAAQNMIKSALQLPHVEHFYLNDNTPHCFSISAQDINGRFDAGYHHSAVKAILQHSEKYAVQMSTLHDKSLVRDIILPCRFKRHYVSAEHGVPFIGGKEILELNPGSDKYLSLKQHRDLIANSLTLDKDMLLVTRSGTIGKVALVPEHWQGRAASEHLLRVIPSGRHRAGYLYAWLSSEWALPLIRRHTYGAVIFEIDQHHLADVEVPLLEEPLMSEINHLVLEANRLRYLAFQNEQLASAIFKREITD